MKPLQEDWVKNRDDREPWDDLDPRDIGNVYERTHAAMFPPASSDLYDAWVRVWRCVPAASVAAEMIAGRNTYFGVWNSTRVNLAIMVLSEVLDAAMWEAASPIPPAPNVIPQDLVNRLLEAVRLLANPESNQCWGMLNDEYKSWLTVTAATS